MTDELTPAQRAVLPPDLREELERHERVKQVASNTVYCPHCSKGWGGLVPWPCATVRAIRLAAEFGVALRRLDNRLPRDVERVDGLRECGVCGVLSTAGHKDWCSRALLERAKE
jgi:hypothetical protein